MSKITIQDVARRAGVSVATIDRVLNRRPGVKALTVEKVETAIRELNYQPDRIAARLARGKDYRLWFILPTTAGEFMQSIAAEVEDAARRMAAERVTIMELRESMCRWPLGDPTTPEFRFCGANSPIGEGPYCAYHATIAYQPAQDRRRDRSKAPRI